MSNIVKKTFYESEKTVIEAPTGICVYYHKSSSGSDILQGFTVFRRKIRL